MVSFTCEHTAPGPSDPELVMGWVHPWVGLGWVLKKWPMTNSGRIISGTSALVSNIGPPLCLPVSPQFNSSRLSKPGCWAVTLGPCVELWVVIGRRWLQDCLLSACRYVTAVIALAVHTPTPPRVNVGSSSGVRVERRTAFVGSLAAGIRSVYCQRHRGNEYRTIRTKCTVSGEQLGVRNLLQVICGQSFDHRTPWRRRIYAKDGCRLVQLFCRGERVNLHHVLRFTPMRRCLLISLPVDQQNGSYTPHAAHWVE